MRLSASVGRMGVNKKHDVALVQKIMKSIKIKTRMGTQYLYKGSVDGIYRRDMEPLIVCMQGLAKLRETGKLEPTTQTMNAINRIVPPNLRNLSAMEGTKSVFTTGKSNPNADRVARDIEMKAPFPKSERKALADAVRKVGKETGFCIKRKRDFITPQGNFATEMGFDSSSVAEAGTGQDAKKAVTKILGNTNGWSALPSPPMACKSKLQLKCLQNLGNAPISADEKKLLGLTMIPTEPILKSLTKGCARLIASGRLAKQASRQEAKKEAGIIIDAVRTDRRLFAACTGAVRNAAVGDFGFDTTTMGNIRAGLAMLGPRVSQSAQSLKAFDASASRLVEKYFVPFSDGGFPFENDPEIIAGIIAERIEAALAHLTGRPIKDIIFPFPGDAPEGVREVFLGPTKPVAVELAGSVYLHVRRFNRYNPVTHAAILLHEGMHRIIDSSAAREDFRYISQGVEGLGVRAAIRNADSFVALVFDDVIDQIWDYADVRV